MTPRNGSTNGSASGAGAESRRILRGLSLNGWLGLSLLALILAGAFVVTAVASIVMTAFARGATDVQPAEQVAELVALNQQKMQTYQDRFNGRSVFFKPPAPPVTKPVATKREPAPTPPPPPPPPPPSQYDGPSIIYAFSDMVRFKAPSSNDKPLEIRVGEEADAGGIPLRVISTDNLPWFVRLGWKGKEFDVKIFTNGGDKYLLAQAEPVPLIKGFIEVMPPRPEVEIPKGTDPGTPPAPNAATARGSNAPNQAGDRGGPNRPTARAAARPEPQQPPGRQPQPAREATQDEEEDPEPSDEKTQTDDDEPDGRSQPPPGRRRPPPPPDDEEEAEEEEEPQATDEEVEEEEPAAPQEPRGGGSPSPPAPSPRPQRHGPLWAESEFDPTGLR